MCIYIITWYSESIAAGDISSLGYGSPIVNSRKHGDLYIVYTFRLRISFLLLLFFFYYKPLVISLKKKKLLCIADERIENVLFSFSFCFHHFFSLYQTWKRTYLYRDIHVLYFYPLCVSLTFSRSRSFASYQIFIYVGHSVYRPIFCFLLFVASTLFCISYRLLVYTSEHVSIARISLDTSTVKKKRGALLLSAVK